MLPGKASGYVLGDCQRKTTRALGRLVFFLVTVPHVRQAHCGTI
jgi:hypothetical protein